MPEFDESIQLPDGRRVTVQQAIAEGLLNKQDVGQSARRAEDIGVANAGVPATPGRFQDQLMDMLKVLGVKAKENTAAKYGTDATGITGGLNRFAKGFESGAERARSAYDSVVGTKDRKPWMTPEEREQDRIIGQFDKLAPEMQRQQTAADNNSARIQAADMAKQSRMYEADQRLKSKVYEVSAKKGLNEAQTALFLSQAKEHLAKSDKLDVETSFAQAEKDFFSKTGFLAGKAPTTVQEAAELEKNPAFLSELTKLSLAKGAPGLFKAGQGNQRTSTGERNLRITTPNGDFFKTFPTHTTSGQAPNPQAQQMLQQLLGGGGGQQAPVDTSLVPGMAPQGGQQPQGPPQAQAPAPQIPQAFAARAKAPVRTPAPVNTLAASGGAQAKPDDFFRPADYWGTKQQDGKIPFQTDKETATQTALRDRGNATSSALSSILKAGPKAMEEITALAALDKAPLGFGKAEAAARRRMGLYSAQETLVRSALADVKMEEIKNFTGKQSAEREYQLMQQTTPNDDDSPEALTAKLVKRELLFKYWRMVNEGDRGQTNSGVNPKYRTSLDDKFYTRVNTQAEDIAKLYMSGKQVPSAKLDPMKFLRADIDDIRKR